jgi:lipopolysaccharide biosynthesis glycosyltransferase
VNNRDDEINVVYATDCKGALGCAVSGRSILEQLPATRSVTFWILDWNVSAADRNRIADTLRGTLHHAAVSFVPIDSSKFSGLLHSKRIPPVAYARLLLGDVLPRRVEKCLYMDIDTVCTANVEELFDADMDGAVVGAVLNGDGSECAKNFRRLGVRGDRYFGSGVLLCDLKRWRAEEVGEKALNFAREAGDILIMHDQDALNAILKDSWLELPERWNRWAVSQGSQADCIVHYTTSPKPWDADYNGPGAGLFFEYVDKTAFEGFRPWNPGGLGSAFSRYRRRMPYLPTVIRIARKHLRRKKFGLFSDFRAKG